MFGKEKKRKKERKTVKTKALSFEYFKVSL
jgi:hypothetical protein